MWRMTLNSSEVRNGSLIPSRYGTMIRCPDDDTGRNSVSPCTVPMMNAATSGSMSRPQTATGSGDRVSALPDEQRGEDEGDRGQELQKDVERRAGRVLERVADGVADDGRRVGIRLLAEDVALVVLEVARLD